MVRLKVKPAAKLSENIAFNVTESTVKKLRKLAKAEKLTMSKYLRQLIEKHLD